MNKNEVCAYMLVNYEQAGEVLDVLKRSPEVSNLLVSSFIHRLECFLAEIDKDFAPKTRRKAVK